MYKALTLAVLVVATIAYGSQSFASRSHYFERLPSSIAQNKVALDLCPTCINEAVAAINVLLNIILDEGIVATCGDLCGILANKTGSKALGDVCDLACDGLGIDEFIRLIIKVDLDPIWYCELADLCPINDQGDAKFTNFQVTPNTGHSGTEFVIDCSFITKNGTGTSMLTLEIIDPKNESSSNDLLIEARKPGTYSERIGFKTLNKNCDPTTGLCDAWPIGTYNVTARLCNGECGSQHPHSGLYDFGKSYFNITKKS